MQLSPMENLLAVLHATGKPVCIIEATRLQTSKAGRFELHLRSANLTSQDISILIPAIMALAETNEHQLKSFSISDNTHIGDQAAIELLTALPTTLRELGMVGCDLTDITVNHLVKWAKTSPSLKMLCVEGNQFSSRKIQMIKDLAKNRPISIYA